MASDECDSVTQGMVITAVCAVLEVSEVVSSGVDDQKASYCLTISQIGCCGFE